MILNGGLKQIVKYLDNYYKDQTKELTFKDRAYQNCITLKKMMKIQPRYDSLRIIFTCSPFNKAIESYVNSYLKVITTLKTTTFPVTDLYFPAITICGSGKHMSLVEKVCFLFRNITKIICFNTNIETVQPIPHLEKIPQERPG